MDWGRNWRYTYTLETGLTLLIVLDTLASETTMMEKIVFHGIVFAIIVRKDFHKEGISFVTDGDSLLEMGYMSHPKGYLVIPHAHPPFQRQTKGTQEVIFLKSGRMRVDFYSDLKVCVGSKELVTGDWIVLLAGGHGIELLEPSVLIEVKNGPYAGENDKIRFKPNKAEGDF